MASLYVVIIRKKEKKQTIFTEQYFPTFSTDSYTRDAGLKWISQNVK